MVESCIKGVFSGSGSLGMIRKAADLLVYITDMNKTIGGNIARGYRSARIRLPV
jgi:hypothetical protein